VILTLSFPSQVYIIGGDGTLRGASVIYQVIRLLNLINVKVVL